MYSSLACKFTQLLVFKFIQKNQSGNVRHVVNLGLKAIMHNFEWQIAQVGLKLFATWLKSALKMDFEFDLVYLAGRKTLSICKISGLCWVFTFSKFPSISAFLFLSLSFSPSFRKFWYIYIFGLASSYIFTTSKILIYKY